MRLEGLRSAVAAMTSVALGAVTLIEGLTERLSEALADDNMEDVQAIVDELNAAKDSLAAAITENTVAQGAPSEPTPEPAPEGEDAGGDEADSGDESVADG